MGTADPTVVVFARGAEPGRTKTRLIPALGPEGAAELHRRLVRRSIGLAQEARVGPVQVWGDPADDPFLSALARERGLPLRPQRGADLGARMADAFANVLAGGGALLMGCDLADVTAADVRGAAAVLREGSDAVLGPTADGGYWLIGLRRPCPELFAGMPWGTERVAERTRSALAAMGLTRRELAVRHDVDRPSDLGRLEPALIYGLEVAGPVLNGRAGS